MKPFIAVIGKGKSGKSTIIKTLTGCGRSNYRDFLKDNLTGETILIVCGSPREEDLSLAKLRELLKRSADDPKCRGVVMAIQPTWPHTRLSMGTILNEVTSAFQISAFIINPERNGDPADAETIKSRLSNFNVKLQTLDGRRFATINARRINDATGLVPEDKPQLTKALAA